ncbi:hypothetical protein [Streptomyces sp. cg35]|uniref:hypothetical protein n=1 Tax=Streptomyces sp. cg35 TaxID=3421650 RepID=UPI003D16E942
MTEPAADARPEVQIFEVEHLGPGRLALIVRCLATTRLGDRFRCLDRQGRTVDLTVTEIRRYPPFTVTEVAPPHAARLVLTAPGAAELDLRAWDILRGADLIAQPMPDREQGL